MGNPKKIRYYRGPEGPMGPTGPPGPPGPSGSGNSLEDLFPFMINSQNRIIDPLDINESTEREVVSIEITIPSEWKSYDVILTGELYVDYMDRNSGAIMLFRTNNTEGELIGSQMVGHNGNSHLDGIGFTGFHKEILNNQTKTGTIKFSLSVKAIDTLLNRICEVTVINRYIHIQAIRQR